MITADQLRRLAPNCAAPDAWADALSKAADRYEINTPLRLAHWLAQLLHESAGFTHFRENLNYSAERLCQVWPGRFPTLASAQPYAHNPAALAEKVYGGRMGNVHPGDGAKYIGRGPPQITGHDNYKAAEEGTGLPLLDDPAIAETPAGGAMISGWFWHSRALNAFADADDIETITRRVNGGLVGLEDRKAQLARAKSALL